MARRLEERYIRKPRKRKSTILIGAEGTNKTESIYFNNFNRANSNYRIKMANGNSTDPVKMVKDIINTMQQNDIRINEDGNKVYCLIDADINPIKNNQIREAIKLAKKNGIDIIISNPCFEDWYLCHFEYTTKNFTNSEIISELNKFIKYEKNIDIFKNIQDNLDIAIVNAKKQCSYQNSLNRDIHNVESNPSTEVYKIVEYLKIK